MRLPRLPDLPDRPLVDRRLVPVVVGCALLSLGLVLRRLRPGWLEMPKPPARRFGGKGWRGAAQKGRDGALEVLPDNMTDSLGRSLIILGAGLLVVRALDLIVEDDDALY